MAKTLRENPTGIFSLMLTPYNDDKTIDWATYEEYCDTLAVLNIGEGIA